MKHRQSFKTLHETASFSRHIVSHRADLPAKLTMTVKEALLSMHQTEHGRRVLAEFESTTKFEEIPARDLSLMAGLKKYVDAELKLQR
jgi:ABC-type phosphate/phosphonate transport system substrate-binding protein